MVGSLFRSFASYLVDVREELKTKKHGDQGRTVMLSRDCGSHELQFVSTPEVVQMSRCTCES